MKGQVQVKNIARYVLWYMIIAAIGLIAGEVVMRIKGVVPQGSSPFAIATMEPGPLLQLDSLLGADLQNGQFTITLNSGLHFTANHRDGSRQVGFVADSGSSCIWLYGCSFFYGFGLPDTQVVSEYLSKSLEEWQVMNRAVPEYSNVQCLLKMRQDMKHWQPGDAVVFSYAPFHKERNAMLLAYRNKLFSFGKKEFIAQAVFPSAQLVNDSLHIVRKPFTYTPFIFRQYSSLMYGLEQMSNEWRDESVDAENITRGVLEQCWREVSEKQVRFTFAPLKTDQSTQEMMNALEAQGAQVIDLSVDFGNAENSLMPLDAHSSARIHAYYAECITDWMIR